MFLTQCGVALGGFTAMTLQMPASATWSSRARKTCRQPARCARAFNRPHGISVAPDHISVVFYVDEAP
jgi:hypothetical protein